MSENIQETFNIDPDAHLVFNYLKEMLTINVNCDSNSHDETRVRVSLYLKNPKTGKPELICEDTATAY